MNLIAENITETTFDEIINEMIVNAWYSVLEFHIHLSGIVVGEVKDGLERAVLKLSNISDLPANASKVEMLPLNMEMGLRFVESVYLVILMKRV